MTFQTIKALKISLRALVTFSILTGVAYPLLVTGLARLAFPKQAAGSRIEQDGKTVGSALIGQKFTNKKYFQGRPSANDYATIPSGASNLSPTSEALKTVVTERRTTLGPEAPADLLTASASGLDPHLSPIAAFYQIRKVAEARSLTQAEISRLEELVTTSIEPPQFGFLGKSRVNILLLNLTLDHEFGTKTL